MSWELLDETTAQQAIEQGVILQLTVPLIMPRGFVGVIQNGILQPGEPEHGDSVVLSPEWKEGALQEIITEHYVHSGQTGIVIPRMIRVSIFEDSPESVAISHAFRR